MEPANISLGTGGRWHKMPCLTESLKKKGRNSVTIRIVGIINHGMLDQYFFSFPRLT
jgi:hypothetical protein